MAITALYLVSFSSVFGHESLLPVAIINKHMSSIVHHPQSKNLHLDIPTPDGPVRVSSRTTNKEAAKLIGAKLHLFAKDNKGKKVTKLKVMDAAEMLAKVVNTECMEPSPLDVVLPALVVQTAKSQTNETIKQLVVDRFIGFMKEKDLDKMDIWNVGPSHISEFLAQDRRAHGYGDWTARTYGHALGVLFEAAFKLRLAPQNVVRLVEVPKRPKYSPRRPFTDDELVAVYFAGDEEWKGMVVTGSATGMRIGDVALSVVGDFDSRTGFLRPMNRKADLIEAKPLPSWLVEHWKAKFQGRPPDEPLFPRAYKWMWINGRLASSRVAMEFKALLIRAGVRQPGKVRGVERVGANKYLPLTFHCLRHTYTTLLKIACASEAMAREIVGHKSASVSQIYTHIDEKTTKAAVEDLPNPLRPHLSQKVSDQICLFDSGHLPLGTWVYRFSRGSHPWDGATIEQIKHVQTGRTLRFLYHSAKTRAAARNN
jgi:integrase